MRFIVRKSKLQGSVQIPGSKSHTIRAVAIAALASGTSCIRKPLVAEDTLAAVRAYRLFGADIDCGEDWVVRGVAGKPCTPENVIDVGNSGTTLYIAMSSAALAPGTSVLTGDDQIRRRPAGPLIAALNQLGASAESTRGTDRPPIIVRGPMRGGTANLDGSKTSQYLTSLLINCPLAAEDTVLSVHNLVEKPYIDMTLSWLAEQHIRIDRSDYEEFRIAGGQKYSAFDKQVPADFSSATFFLTAAAVTGSELILLGLDPNDTQGDKRIVDVLSKMGADVEWLEDGLRIKGNGLVGGTFDLGDTPDALPALAVTGCFAEGETRLINVGQARLKETDRITVMCSELSKMGAQVEELPDGLVVRQSQLRAAQVDGHGDHRVVMALAVAGLGCEGETVIEGAEAVAVTFPTFADLMKSVGGDIRTE
ncbi:MAG: 3-phosphoshikimate 1-carboxyvinyltransferase [Armatimonadota bacterium]|nr:3-phosphoshikimate 1-carboxyvinyltransferase [Armatimonadota bacterium]